MLRSHLARRYNAAGHRRSLHASCEDEYLNCELKARLIEKVNAVCENIFVISPIH